MKEIWTDINEYEGLYQVSNLGKVWSVRNQILLKQCKRNGYLQVSLNKNGKGKTRSVHRLVAFAFLPLIPGKNCVNHIDENKQNNNANNLEWCNHYENNHHGTRSIRVSNRMRNSKKVKAGREIASNKSKRSIKQHFTKGTYKSEYPKRLLYIISLLTVYELSKYVTNEIIIHLTANDEIDAPCDYDMNSQADLNGVHNYNAGGK